MQRVPHFQPIFMKRVNDLLLSTSNTAAPEHIGIDYQVLPLCAKIDPQELYHLTNLLITQGLPKELKTAKVMVIDK
jgi:hypothetical protein